MVTGYEVSRENSESPPTARYPRMQSSQQVFVTAGGALADINISDKFTIRSVRIDNETSQWIRLLPNMDFIRPYTSRVILNVRGQNPVSIIRQSPVPTAQGALNNGEFVIVTLYDRPQFEYPTGVPNV